MSKLTIRNEFGKEIKTIIPKGWLPPKWSEDLKDKIEKALYKKHSMKYRSTISLNLSAGPLSCTEKIREKYVMFPSPGEKCFRYCGEEPVWWYPGLNFAYCDKHILLAMKESIYQAWTQLKTETMFDELDKIYHFK